MHVPAQPARCDLPVRAAPRDPRADAPRHRRDRHAGDINDQPGGAVLRGMRPIAAGPPAHLFKRRPFAHRIGVAHGQHWAKAAVAPFQLMSKSARVLALFSPRLCRCLAKPAAPGSGYRSSGSRRHGLTCPSRPASDSWFGPPRMRTEATAHGQRDRLSRRGNDQPAACMRSASSALQSRSVALRT